MRALAVERRESIAEALAIVPVTVLQHHLDTTCSFVVAASHGGLRAAAATDNAAAIAATTATVAASTATVAATNAAAANTASKAVAGGRRWLCVSSVGSLREP